MSAARANVPDLESVWVAPQTEAVRSVQLGDSDGDGDLDQLISIHNGPNRVERNNGANAFSSIWTSTESDSSFAAIWGDYDNDGDLDQLVGNGLSPNRVYRNDGGNSFTLVWSSPESDNTSSLAWGDFDNDGDLDQLAGTLNGPNRVYRNDGGDTFNLVWSSTESDTTRAVNWGDVDGDGDLDQYVGNHGQPNRVYRNDGGGVFTLAWSSPESDPTVGAILFDSDGDGDLDLAAGNSVSPIRLYENIGADNFTLVWSSTEMEEPWALASGDYDGDGDTDLFTGNLNVVNRVVYLNSGGNQFTPGWTSPETESTKSIAIGDTDGDGDMDMLAGSYTDANRHYQNTRILNNTAPTVPTLTAEADGFSGSVKLEWSPSTDSQTTNAALLTYNLRVGTTPGGNEVFSAVIPAGPGNVGQALSHTLVLSGGVGVSTYYWSVQAVDNTGFVKSAFATEDSFVLGDFHVIWSGAGSDTAGRMAWGDLNQDNNLDILMGGRPTHIFSNDGNNSFNNAFSFPLDNGSWPNAWGDYDNDGDLDMLEGINGGQSKLYRNDGNYQFTVAWTNNTVQGTSSLAWGDFDNDGDLDILMGNYDPYQNAADQKNRVYRNDGSDQFTEVWVSVEDEGTNGVAWGDFDRDGDLDILIGNYAVPSRVYRNDGNASFTLLWSSTENLGVRSVEWGDSDGDGDLDILFGISNNSRVYRNNGDNTFSPIWETGINEYQSSAAFGDYDGDGDLDILTAGNDQPNRIFKNIGNNNFELAYTSPEKDGNISAVWGDYDNDGDLDMLVGSFDDPKRVYRNNLNHTNFAPSAPVLTARTDTLSGSVALRWVASTDSETPNANMLTYNLRVGTTPGGSEIVSSVGLAGPGNMGQFLSHSLTLSAGAGTVTYYWSVQAVDPSFKKSAFAVEDSFVVGDITAPTGGSVADNGQFQLSAETISTSWSGFTDTVGVTGYSYSVGTAAGLSDVISPTLTTSTSINTSFTAVADDTTLFVRVQARDEAGNWSTAVDSDGIRVDLSAPGGSVLISDEGQYTTSSTQLSASWSGFSDSGSGISRYDYSIGTSAGATGTQDWTSAGLSTSVLLTGLSLADGSSYFINVRALDAVGNQSGTSSSDGILVDTSAPTTVTGLVDDGASQTGLTTLSASWVAATDAHSGISAYSVSIITAGGQVISQSVTGVVTSIAFSGLALEVGTTYYIQIQAINNANLTGSVALTDGIEIQAVPDTENPSAVSNLVDDGATQTGLTTLSASWTAATDNVAVTGYVVTLLNGTTVISQSTVTTTNIVFTGLSLTVGETYTVRVIPMDAATNEGTATETNGIQIVETDDNPPPPPADTTPPSAVSNLVDDGATQTDLTTLSASWTAATDNEAVTSYVVTLINGTTVISQSTVTTTNIVFTGLSLTVGETYTVRVIANDAANNEGAATETDGIQVVELDGVPPPPTEDTTAPTAVSNLVDDGATQTSLRLTSLSASWTAATDNVAVTAYVVTLLNGNTVISQSTVTTTNIVFSGLSLTVGQTYTIRVIAKDAAGNEGPATTTDGIQIVAPLPPTPPVNQTGDRDGDGVISIQDALDVNKIAGGKIPVTPAMLEYLDVSQPRDGKITTEDANLILRCARGTIRGNPLFPWCSALTRNAASPAVEGGN